MEFIIVFIVIALTYAFLWIEGVIIKLMFGEIKDDPELVMVGFIVALALMFAVLYYAV